MLINSIIVVIISAVSIYISELIKKAIIKKYFRNMTKRIAKVNDKLQELRNLIRLTLLHDDKKTYQKLQKEYGELYYSTFFQKTILFSLFFIPIILILPLVYFIFKDVELYLPATTLYIFSIIIYLIILLTYALFKRSKN